MPVITSFRAVRWLRTLNLVLQAVLFVTLFAGLNYVAKNHASRFDLTRGGRFSLSAETLAYLANLQRPVHIVLTTGGETENPEVKGLIDEYVHATADRSSGLITKETVDVYQNRRRAEELGLDQAGVILLVSGDRRRIEPIDNLYTLKNKQRDTFHGEQALTAAILDVTMLRREKIYFVTGHGELRIDNPDPQLGLTALRDQLKVRNFEVEPFDFSANRKIPDDASLLVVVSPQSAFTRQEQENLRQYLATGAGRLIFFLSPGKTTAALGLDDLLLDWGILVHPDIILDPGPGAMTENLELLIRHLSGTHPITKSLVTSGSQALRFGLTRTVFPDPGRALGGGLNTVTIAATTEQAWGERGGFRAGETPRYDPGVDTRPLPGMDPPNRLGVIVASERTAARDNLPFSVRGGKIVVVGTGDAISNGRLDNASLLLALNAVNWCVDRDHQLSIPPRPIERFQLAMSAADFTKLRYLLLAGLPGLAMLLGFAVYWTRRS
ncbi:MAG: GldG family protein [Opitutaceae bacterium]|nr:GldG family protein [Opitutaceae bacterium]